MAADGVLFYLLANGELARAVVELNPSYAASLFGRHALVFKTDRPSKTAGRLATFGRHEKNDIRLPTGPPGCRGPGRGAGTGRSYQNYRNDHFLFFLAESGELILRDLTGRLTQIEVANASCEEAYLYALHGDKPRQRVIPRTTREVYIMISKFTIFTLLWNPELVGEAAAQQALARQAARLAVTGMTLTKPGESELQPAPVREYNLRSRYTPSHAPGPYKYCHKYARLGEGNFGVVSKVVDLSNGELWAVKEIKEDAKDDRWKTAFKEEVEVLAPLRHPNIVHFESYQDFCIGGSFKLYFRLYRGSLRELLPPHACIGRLPDIAPWTLKFVDQVLGALEYLHGEGVIHRDIKPDNVLFDFKEGDVQPSFYLADFGLSVNTDNASESTPAGTLAYMAPETVFDDETDEASDIWSFAIMLGRVLGYWCEREQSMTPPEWANKLAFLGGERPYLERTLSRLPASGQQRWYYGIWSLVEGGFLPTIFTRMLTAAPHRATPADCRRAREDEFIRRPNRPCALATDSEGNAVWHLAARSANEMSIDVLRGRHWG